MWHAARVTPGLPTTPDVAVRAAQLRVDVIRNILAVGAGAGALIALFVALRREYVKERVDHADLEHRERVATDAKYDASERRVTELYVKASEQLGSEKAAVRLASVYALERLGQDNIEHRQTILEVLCAYLRMPYRPAAVDLRLGSYDLSAEEKAAQNERLLERQVRLTIQTVLRKHLEYGEEESVQPFYWADARLDLTGATLIAFNLVHCKFDILDATNARFLGRTDLSKSRMTGIRLNRAVFEGPATLIDVKGTAEGLSATYTEFLDSTNLIKVEVPFINFEGAVFGSGCKFEDITGFCRLEHAVVSNDIDSENVVLPTGWQLSSTTTTRGDNKRMYRKVESV
jgi:hypothetical protein